jgi:hypothetical protein
MPRLIGWEDRFQAVIAHHGSCPLLWGVSDCFVMPMDDALALTGVDPWAAERRYRSAGGALRALRRNGFGNVVEAFAAHYAEVAPSFARRGDIGVADYPGAVLGGGVVVLGADVIGKGEQGVVRLPRARLLRAFRVE